MESGRLPLGAESPGQNLPTAGPTAEGANEGERPDPGLSAEEWLRLSYGRIVWTGILASTLLHFLLFALWPQMSAQDVSFATTELENVELPPEVEVPPAPEEIARPATPVVADASMEIDEDLTIAPTTFEENPVSALPPPRDEEAPTKADLYEAPAFTPYTVAPALVNRSEAARAILREWPAMLKEARIGGTVVVWFFIDEEGRVQNTKVSESSGLTALDAAALRVADVFRFSPALNRDQEVRVWVELPITFRMTD